MKILENTVELNQWYMLKDTSLEGSKAKRSGEIVLAFIVTDYYCMLSSKQHIIKVNHLIHGEITYSKIVRDPKSRRSEQSLYEPVSYTSVVAFLL